MGLSTRQQGRRVSRSYGERFTAAEKVVLKALREGERTLDELVEEYCRGLRNGGPVTAKTRIRQLVGKLRAKGIPVKRRTIYRIE